MSRLLDGPIISTGATPLDAIRTDAVALSGEVALSQPIDPSRRTETVPMIADSDAIERDEDFELGLLPAIG